MVSFRVFPSQEPREIQTKLILVISESVRKQVGSKFLILSWMSLGWSWLWKDEQDTSFHHTLCLQVKRTCKLNKILLVTSGLKIAGPLCDNQGPFKGCEPSCYCSCGMLGFQTCFSISMEKKEFLWRTKENSDPHRRTVTCSQCSPVSALHTVCKD